MRNDLQTALNDAAAAVGERAADSARRAPANLDARGGVKDAAIGNIQRTGLCACGTPANLDGRGSAIDGKGFAPINRQSAPVNDKTVVRHICGDAAASR
ncbi:hypothetical protein FACS1894185_4030 [Betaproteobacteria bacterium]|nr:hypothetical protein FACS1894185_4030 [Betaproteobacteria bacterium]